MQKILSLLDEYFRGSKPSSLITGSILGTCLAYVAYKFATTPFDEIKEMIVRNLLNIAKNVPGTAGIVEKEQQKTIKKLRHDLHKDLGIDDYTSIPDEPVSKETILSMLQQMKAKEDPKWKEGKVSGAVYYGEEEMTNLQNEVYSLYSTSNALHPDIWPSLRKFEAEIVRMTVKMLNGDKNCCGAITSGGSESIIMAVKAARDYGMKVKGIRKPEV